MFIHCYLDFFFDEFLAVDDFVVIADVALVFCDVFVYALVNGTREACGFLVLVDRDVRSEWLEKHLDACVHGEFILPHDVVVDDEGSKRSVGKLALVALASPTSSVGSGGCVLSSMRIASKSLSVTAALVSQVVPFVMPNGLRDTLRRWRLACI